MSLQQLQANEPWGQHARVIINTAIGKIKDATTAVVGLVRLATTAETTTGTATDIATTPAGVKAVIDALKAAANTWTAVQTTIIATASASALIARSTADSATFGPQITIDRERPAGVANDELGSLAFNGRSSTGVARTFGNFRARIKTATNGAEDGEILMRVPVAGAVGISAILGAGLQMGAPTGGDKGTGTINAAGDIYKNNSAYTNPDYVLEYAFTGKIERFADKPGAAGYRGPLSLDELDSYVRAHFRLPGISDEPMGMFERGDKALEKIEELTLYIIELHKRIKALEG